jgi:hypothetical protein
MTVSSDRGRHGDFGDIQRLAARAEAGHHAVALRIAHAAPACDLVHGAAAAEAHSALRVHYADFDAGAFQTALLAASARPAREAGSLPRTPQIHCPMPTRRSRSTPVSMPMPWSMYTTSSVATLPVAPRA